MIIIPPSPFQMPIVIGLGSYLSMLEEQIEYYNKRSKEQAEFVESRIKIREERINQIIDKIISNRSLI